MRQVFFSTIHELGHIFNLQHIDQPKNYMSTSSSRSTYPPQAFTFHPRHVQILSIASSHRTIWPGGSPFADIGSVGHFDSLSWRELGDFESGLELSIDMVRRSFFYFEPVELEIALRVTPGINRRFRLPDRIDPGYDNFRLWIEEPTGERRLYRSPRQYCAQHGVITVAPDRSFQRDISIFGQAGGFTFRRAGIHKIWAEFALPRRGKLMSNTIEVELLDLRKRAADFDRAEELFESTRGRILTYHRIDYSRGKALKAFEGFLEANPLPKSDGVLCYAMGRAYLSRRNELQSESARENCVSRGRYFLRLALDNENLGQHQRNNAERLSLDLS